MEGVTCLQGGCYALTFGLLMLASLTGADAPAEDGPSSRPPQHFLHEPRSPQALPASLSEASTPAGLHGDSSREPEHVTLSPVPPPLFKYTNMQGSVQHPDLEQSSWEGPVPVSSSSLGTFRSGGGVSPVRRYQDLQVVVPPPRIVPSPTQASHTPKSLHGPSNPGTILHHVLKRSSALNTTELHQIGDVEHLWPTYDVNIQNDGATGLDHLMDLSQVSFEKQQQVSDAAEPTMEPLDDFFPSNTMEVDWGSGDYLETMSFMGSEGDDYSLVTNLPSDMYDFEDSNSEAYDTSFPTRVGVSPSSKLFTSTSTLTSTVLSTSPSLRPTITYSLPPSHESTSPPNVPALVNNSNSPISTTQVSKVNITMLPNSTVSMKNISSPLGHVIQSNNGLLDIKVSPVHPTPGLPTLTSSLSPNTEPSELADADWPDVVTVEPTEVLLPDMNSLEYYTIQLAKDNGSSLTEHRANLSTSITPTRIMATSVSTVVRHGVVTASVMEETVPTENSSWPEGSSMDGSGSEPISMTTPEMNLANVTEPALEPSVVLTPSMEPSISTSVWTQGSASSWVNTVQTSEVTPSRTSVWTTVMSSSVVDDVYWFVSQTVLKSDVYPTVLNPTVSATPSVTATPTSNTTSQPPFMDMADQAITTETTVTTVTDASGSAVTAVVTDPVNATNASLTPGVTTVTPATEITTIMVTETFDLTPVTTTTTTTIVESTTPSPAETTTAREYLCNISKPDTYLVRVGFPPGSTAGYAKSKVQEILKTEFNQSVELQVVKAPPDFVFRVVSGPVVYTAISVINALRQSPRSSRSVLSASRIGPTPDKQYQVHTVLQFVPSHVDVRVCTFSEHVERGLSAAFAEVRRQAFESTDFSVHIVNISTSSLPKAPRLPREPVVVTFAVRGAQGYLLGSEVSAHLRLLNMVEFSFYLGLPVLQMAEPFHYPELNTTQLLRSSWVRTVLLGVTEQRVNERIFQAKMERRLALLLGEALGVTRRIKRATSVGNNSIQIVRASRLPTPENPLELVYFVETATGERLPAVTTANTLNRLDVQRAAIVLGYRVQGVLAQPVEKVASMPGEMEGTNVWVVVGVVVPVLVVLVIISILYWKLCRTDKLEFQPDAMATGPQRQKLQAPSVKGFDFAKLHLGQHSKDDIMVIQEPLPMPVAAKEPSASDNGEVPTPKSKTSSSKASRNGRRRGRISPSDGDSVVSEPSSERNSPGGVSPRGVSTTGDGKQPRKAAVSSSHSGPAAPGNGPEEPLSSASIFEHVDRMSRTADGPKRFSNKIQLIAMQPMPAPPLHSPTLCDRAAENDINKEIQVALRHKSDIEHHRNKIRLRAKRKGHYDFPAMDDLVDGLGDPKEQDRIYQKAQQQIDKILDPDMHLPSIFTEPKKSKGKRSPKQKKTSQVNGAMMDADRDRLITADSDATYRRYPGVSNIAYVSDPDQPPEPGLPSPSDDVFLGPNSPPPGHAPPPPPYLPPQPSIEEARQQMHSLLDDAFALVSPTFPTSAAGITLPGVGNGHAVPPGSSPPSRGPPRIWAPSYPALSSFSGRCAEMGMSPPAVHGLMQRQCVGSGYPVEGLSVEQQPPEGFSCRGGYSDDLPSSARPRPVGGTTGAQLHQLTQVGLPSRLGALPPAGRMGSSPSGGYGWNPYEDDASKAGNLRDASPRMGLKEPSAPPAHLDPPGLGYALSSEDPPPPTHTSASLIKAIREELMRLSQKQAALPTYHG
ncbi:UPF0606 protein KIAA1549 isoform X4 [Denticeps clupeoides]|uniref:Uncharacterized protein n=1 Tax=Denticeps clupeoides TaxID=299321 RepID=A0AAY4DNS8_9TELE|nr:UPF0606 protein KIAA1549 homolog isoform X4 [Denticeps clupeoides]